MTQSCIAISTTRWVACDGSALGETHHIVVGHIIIICGLEYIDSLEKVYTYKKHSQGDDYYQTDEDFFAEKFFHISDFRGGADRRAFLL